MISVSTHVLDTERGEPARGLSVALFQGEQRIAAERTDSGGRIGQLAQALEAGAYRLEFDLAAYFVDQGRPAPFLQRLSLEVMLNEDRHYHLPLLLGAYACTTYRGS